MSQPFPEDHHSLPAGIYKDLVEDSDMRQPKIHNFSFRDMTRSRLLS